MAEDLIVSTDSLVEYLGVDDDKKTEVEELRASAINEILNSAGISKPDEKNVGTYNDTVRTLVYMSYYAVRDSTKNTAFLASRSIALIANLRAGKE